MLRPRLASSLVVLLVSACLWLPSCASVSLKRSTQTSGTYQSSGWAVTLFSIDIPRGALKIARENAADFHLANTTETYAKVTPDIAWLNWLFNIVSVRKATVKGTWGFTNREE